jgi:hypothetical protein
LLQHTLAVAWVHTKPAGEQELPPPELLPPELAPPVLAPPVLLPPLLAAPEPPTPPSGLEAEPDPSSLPQATSNRTAPSPHDHAFIRCTSNAPVYTSPPLSAAKARGTVAA